MESNRIIKHLDRLLLDPNNYRFIDKAEYVLVKENQLDSQSIQRRTLNFLLGDKAKNVSDLISSFQSNGFLDIDQIQVKAIGDKYLVLEGNRRVATLKFLYEEFKNGNDIGKLTERNFKSIDLVEVIDEDPVQHLIAMGLHHISGKKRWSAVNEAQLIEDLRSKHGKTETEICSSLGISTTALRRSSRTLALIRDYKKSDFGDQFTSGMYSIFEAVIGNPIMKQWVEWNDNEYKAENQTNLDRFYTWISQTEKVDRETDRNDKIIREPIITQYRQVKEVASFVEDKKALKRMEESQSIAEGYTFSEAVGEAKLREAVDSIKSSIQVTNNFRDLLNTRHYDDLKRAKKNIEDLIPSSKAQILLQDKKASILFDDVIHQFTELHISKYRKLEDITVKKLKRVNIFAGGNNMGKTSVLEAFYLLSQLNDIPAYLELGRYRGKFLSEFHSKWIDKNFIDPIILEAEFNNAEVEILIEKEATEENIERTGYLDTITSTAKVEDRILESHIHLFATKEPDYRYTKANILCNAAFTSPYRYNEKLLHEAHKMAVENRYFDKVIEFIRSFLDEGIEKIDLVNDEGENRFKVTSSSIEKAVDITKYGEGLQRVFEIALLLGYCSNGILCIDEIDSALH
ncbi:MAG: AAA family ATPase [Flavobacteriales bacterium]|nr:AAA family ATPase [Flavobacteriales bacterium]